RRLRTRKRLRRELSCGVDALAQPHDPHLAVHVLQTAVYFVSDQESDRVGAAVDRRHPIHVQLPFSRIPAIAGSSAKTASAWSPKGFTPGPLASECAIRTCRHLTRSGMPPPENVVPSDSIASRSAK